MAKGLQNFCEDVEIQIDGIGYEDEDDNFAQSRRVF